MDSFFMMYKTLKIVCKYNLKDVFSQINPKTFTSQETKQTNHRNLYFKSFLNSSFNKQYAHEGLCWPVSFGIFDLK